jgi:Ulp1 family protease
LGDEAINKKKTFNQNEWKIVPRQGRDVPNQSNDFDCGMFVILCADAIVNNLPLDETSYSQSVLPEYRILLAQAISLGKLFT